jgi:hypothetical protein
MTNLLKFKQYKYTQPESYLEFRTYSMRGLIHRIDKTLFKKYSTHLKN